jgi:hypothetical protein
MLSPHLRNLDIPDDVMRRGLGQGTTSGAAEKIGLALGFGRSGLDGPALPVCVGELHSAGKSETDQQVPEEGRPKFYTHTPAAITSLFSELALLTRED